MYQVRTDLLLRKYIDRKCPLRPMVYSCLKFNDMHHTRPVIIVGRDANDVSELIIQIPIRWMDHGRFALSDSKSNQNT